jgi:tetratricopeptide (TPR) repeat protein
MNPDAQPPSPVEETLREARRLMAAGQLDAAWTELEPLFDSGHGVEAAPAAYELGRRRRGPQEAARIVFQRVYESGHEDLVARVAIRLGTIAKGAGDRDRARAFYERAIEIGTPHEVTAAAFNLGLLYHQDGEPEHAEHWYRHALAHGDGSAVEVPLNLGLLREAAGDVDEARALYQRAMETGSGSGLEPVALALGELLRRQGAYAEAEPYLRRAVQARIPKAAFALGRMLFAQRRLEEAEVELRRAVDDYGDLSALMTLGDVLVSKVDPGADPLAWLAPAGFGLSVHGYSEHLPAGPEIEEAEADYRQAIAVGQHAALVHLGHLLMGTDRAEEAERCLREAVRVGAPDAEFALAALLHLRGEDAEAVRVLEPAVAAGEAHALIMLADLRSHEGRYAEAAELFGRAVSSGGASLGVRAMQFTTLLLAADLDGAAEVLREMIESGDEAGIAGLEALIGTEEPLADGLRQVRSTADPAEVRRFVALCAEAMRE